MGNLVRDSQNPVEALIASDVEVPPDLLVSQNGRASLYLDKARPAFAASRTNDRPVRNVCLTVGSLEADLRESINAWRPGGAQLSKERMAELRHTMHDREQAGSRALLLLLLASDAVSRD